MLILCMILLTIVIYFFMAKLYARFGNPFLFPVLTATILIIVVLSIFSVPYDVYMGGAKWIDVMLGPAVVSLAYPLYTQRESIKKNAVSIFSSVIVALLSGIISIVLFAKLMKLEDELLLSLLSKSITTPVAMQISESVGGNPALTVVFVMVAGLTGAIAGPFCLKVFRIEKTVSRGVSIGSASHGFGVSKLSEYGEQALSMGSVAMTLSAVVGAFICPIVVWLLI
ncbi:LrgB family protein [Psychrobacillus sp.]|uniref:LrgB family protein n=1 Tax=Psychrobacillus sp. TaxID=1871623 RepID=UPI0028BDDA10|nr:LrgB family protein [Psychrobacillus sp.]